MIPSWKIICLAYFGAVTKTSRSLGKYDSKPKLQLLNRQEKQEILATIDQRVATRQAIGGSMLSEESA